MANNCCETIHCKKLVTINDMNQMLSLANLDCTNYSSAGTKTYNGCCGNIGFSGYSPTYNELTANTGNIRFQNWSEFTNGDKDGFSITNPSWETSSCCTGVANVPIEDVKFKYTTYSGFTANDVDIDACTFSGKSDFSYGIIVHSIDGCSLSETTSAVTYDNSYNQYSDIISALTATSSSDVPMSYAQFDSSFTGITFNEGNVEIFSEDIFSPQLINRDEVINENCEGISAITQSADTYIHIVPKFRTCKKDETYYHVKKDYRKVSMSWTNTGSIISYRGGNIRILLYEDTDSDIKKSDLLNYLLDNNMRCTIYEVNDCGQDVSEENKCDIEFSEEDGTIKGHCEKYGKDVLTIRFIEQESEENKIFEIWASFESNDTGSYLKYEFCVFLGCENVSSCCFFCQEKEDVIELNGRCCIGIWNKFPAINCGENEDSAKDKIRTLNN